MQSLGPAKTVDYLMKANSGYCFEHRTRKDMTGIMEKHHVFRVVGSRKLGCV